MKNMTIDEVLFYLSEIKNFIKIFNFNEILDFLFQKNCSIFSIYFNNNFNDFIDKKMVVFKNEMEKYFKNKDLDLLFFLKLFVIPFLSSNDSFTFIFFKNFTSKIFNLNFSDFRLEKLFDLFLELKLIKDNNGKLIVLNDYLNIFLKEENKNFEEKKSLEKIKKINIKKQNINCRFFSKKYEENFNLKSELKYYSIEHFKQEEIKASYKFSNFNDVKENYTILDYLNCLNLPNLEKESIFLKLRGFRNIEILNILKKNYTNINEANLYKFLNNFFKENRANVVENNFINIFQNKIVSYLTFNEATGLPLESFFYLLNFSKNKCEKREYSEITEFQEICIKNNINFKIKRMTIDEWLDSINENYFFFTSLIFFRLKIKNITLEEIGLNYGITRERVRQKIKLILDYIRF